MSTPKQRRRNISANRLEPIDWHEFANDAVLNGNMSTLYNRPPTEDSTAYASPEALVEIEKRVGRPVEGAVVVGFDAAGSHVIDIPTVGGVPTVGTETICGVSGSGLDLVSDRSGESAVGSEARGSDSLKASVTEQESVAGLLARVPADLLSESVKPTVGMKPTVGKMKVRGELVSDIPGHGIRPTVGTEPKPPTPSAAVVSPEIPTVGTGPAVGSTPTVGIYSNGSDIPGRAIIPTVGTGNEPLALALAVAPTVAVPTVGALPTVGPAPTVGLVPTVGKMRVKPIRDVQDALTLAGHVLYKAMYGAPDGAKSKSCTKGYRQLAAETYLDKDTVRDLISEFKDKGIARETSTYDPDTRSAKTYEVLSYKAILQIWRDVGIVFVTTGRKRPLFCTAQGELLTIVPTVGTEPTVPRRTGGRSDRPTVGPLISALPGRSEVVQGDRQQAAEVIQALQQITGNPVDQEAADRLIRNCSIEAPDCTIEEIVEFAWSKAFLCRSGKIENPIGFLITQVPKHFQREALRAYRENKRKELEAAAASAAREEERRQEAERDLVALEERQRFRSQIAERHRTEQGIDLKGLLKDSESDDVPRFDCGIV